MVDRQKQFRISITELVLFEIQPYQKENFNKAIDFDIELILKMNRETNSILYKTQVTIREKDTENKLASIEIDTVYELYSFDSMIKLQAPVYVIEPELNKVLSRIALGITRGFLSAQVQKTYLSQAVLPLLPVELQ